MTLQEAIEQAISLGENDPDAIAATVKKRYDSKWLATELMKVSDELLRDIARRVLTAQRRSSLSIAKIDRTDRADLMLKAAWLPGIGWVEFGKFKPEDFDLLAATYRRGARALGRYAEWCESSAALMREQGVSEFRLVEGALPALPPAEAA